MLLRHSAIYFIARGVPGLINFLALAVYTRLMAPEQYGYYALAIAIVGLVNVVVWQWLRLGLLRFISSHEEQHQAFLSTLAAAFIFLLIVSACVLGLVLLIWPGHVLIGFAALAILLLWAQAWFEFNLELARSQLSPLLYGGLASTKAIIAITLGAWLAYLGYGAIGVLAGLLAGFALPALWMTWRVWRVVRISMVDRQMLATLAHYGLPLTATFALGFVVSSSDRLIIGWLLDSSAAGLYAVGYDLAWQTLGMLMSIISLSVLPLAVRKLEMEGEAAARRQLRTGSALLLIVILPATLAWMLLAPNIVLVVLDAAYVEAAVRLVPIIAAATLVSGLQRFHFDLAFQMGKRTGMQVWVMLIAALLNVVLNLFWIPKYGLEGAAYATLAAYTSGMVMSWWLGRRIFLMPVPVHLVQILLATFIMVLAILPLLEWRGVMALIVQITAGVTIYATSLLVLNVGNIQGKLAVRWAAFRQ
ncbi:MAG: oligosaccharide flippase family protein [Gammaproteobacteria bacterium]|nr:oligosaccharide flippase family protein [Gammaproteobacteria bacterium]